MPRVSSKTSFYKKEPRHGCKYTFGFAPELIKLILSGEKVSTYKLGNKKDHIKKGDTVIVKIKDGTDSSDLDYVKD